MAGGKNDGAEQGLARVGFNAFHFIFFYDQGIHTRFEVYFAATFDDGVPHILDDARQFVRPYMRMGIRQYGCRSSVLAEYIQYFIYIPAFFASGVQLSIGVGTCTAFSKAIIGFGVYGLLSSYLGQVFFPFPHVFSAFHDDGTQSELYQS